MCHVFGCCWLIYSFSSRDLIPEKQRIIFSAEIVLKTLYSLSNICYLKVYIIKLPHTMYTILYMWKMWMHLCGCVCACVCVSTYVYLHLYYQYWFYQKTPTPDDWTVTMFKIFRWMHKFNINYVCMKHCDVFILENMNPGAVGGVVG